MKIHTVQRLLTALTVTLSVMSTLTPFLEARIVLGIVPLPEPRMMPVGPHTFWSYQHVSWPLEWRFTDYWSQVGYISQFKQPFVNWAGLVFVAMFLTQILTIFFGLISVIKPKPNLLLLSTILSAATVFSMSLIIQGLSDFYVRKTPQPGYFLAFAATALFLTVLVWKVASNRR